MFTRIQVMELVFLLAVILHVVELTRSCIFR